MTASPLSTQPSKAWTTPDHDKSRIGSDRSLPCVNPKYWPGDKGDDVQIAVEIVPARDLEDFRFDDAVGVVLDPLGVQHEGLERRAQLMVKAPHQVQIRHALLDLGRPG
jgi:hypothetical protein